MRWGPCSRGPSHGLQVDRYLYCPVPFCTGFHLNTADAPAVSVKSGTISCPPQAAKCVPHTFVPTGSARPPPSSCSLIPLQVPWPPESADDDISGVNLFPSAYRLLTVRAMFLCREPGTVPTPSRDPRDKGPVGAQCDRCGHAPLPREPDLALALSLILSLSLHFSAFRGNVLSLPAAWLPPLWGLEAEFLTQEPALPLEPGQCMSLLTVRWGPACQTGLFLSSHQWHKRKETAHLTSSISSFCTHSHPSCPPWPP